MQPKRVPLVSSRVLHDVSFRAEPGQVVALVGSSGAGKSTMAQLMPRLYDVESGAVRLANVDVRDLSAESIRDTLGMVTQDGHLFHESVRANLLLAQPEATDGEPGSPTSSSRCPTGTRPSSGNAGTGSPAANANG